MGRGGRGHHGPHFLSSFGGFVDVLVLRVRSSQNRLIAFSSVYFKMLIASSV